MEATTREPACAGRFYPATRSELEQTVSGFLEGTGGAESIDEPRAVIAPHAGYPFSGPVAGESFGAMAARSAPVERVVLLGPSHFEEVPDGLAAPTVEAFETPLGTSPVDVEAVEALVDAGVSVRSDRPHAREHSLETHLPFIQTLFEDVAIVPVVTGRGAEPQVVELLETVCDEATVVSVSSDLSHYLDYESANRVDDETRRAIEALEPDDIRDRQACGHTAVRGLLSYAGDAGLEVETLAMANSGDTAGGRDEVVGYGAWVFG